MFLITHIMYHSIIKILTVLQSTDLIKIVAMFIELFAIRIRQIKNQIANVNFSLKVK